jgi:hypothetical protein
VATECDSRPSDVEAAYLYTAWFDREKGVVFSDSRNFHYVATLNESEVKVEWGSNCGAAN